MRQDILFALHFLNSYPELSLGVNRRKTANEQHNDNYVIKIFAVIPIKIRNDNIIPRF